MMTSKLDLLSGNPIIFTDLDGTLLDHHSYQFDEAARALTFVREQNIPLIINSSKTFAEILPLQHKLGICQPFISENGAAVYFPTNEKQCKSWRCHAFAEPRKRVLDVLSKLRKKGFSFRGFNDCSVSEIVSMTGLPEVEAVLASEREFSEPLQWLGNEEEQKDFLHELSLQGMQAMQGGRFLTVCGAQKFNKGLAMQWFCCQQKNSDQNDWLKIALGDSPNDFPMLAAADVAVLVKAAKSVDFGEKTGSTKIPKQLLIKTSNRGPKGWQEAMDSLIPQLNINPDTKLTS